MGYISCRAEDGLAPRTLCTAGGTTTKKKRKLTNRKQTREWLQGVQQQDRRLLVGVGVIQPQHRRGFECRRGVTFDVGNQSILRGHLYRVGGEGNG